ncbi:MAG: hypothetical protein JO353_14010 [Phycisphaerae bacterium]|nr:hypothetical protein [Phycisphaerae bacterium]
MSAPRQGMIPVTVMAAPGDYVSVLRPLPSKSEPEQRWQLMLKWFLRSWQFRNVHHQRVEAPPAEGGGNA